MSYIGNIVSSPAVGSGAGKKVLAQAFKLVALSFIPAIIGAGLGAMMHAKLLGMVAALASLIVIFAIHKNKDSASAIGWMFLFTGLMGFSVGDLMGTLVHAGLGKVVAVSFGAAVALFTGLSIYAANPNKDFSRWGGILFAGLITLLVLGIANIFLHLPAMSIALAGLGVLIFSMFTIYDVNAAVRNGETNYILLALNLWLNLFNLFMDILRLALEFSKE